MTAGRCCGSLGAELVWRSLQQKFCRKSKPGLQASKMTDCFATGDSDAHSPWNKTMTPFQTILLAASIAIISSGCTKKTPTPPPAASTQPAAQQSVAANTEALTLLDFRIEKNEAGKTVLRGNIGNSATTKIDHAAATFKVFDKAGNEIGTATAGVDNLNARFSWTFEVEIVQEGADSARLVAITAQ